jgi:hypothetical protein
MRWPYQAHAGSAQRDESISMAYSELIDGPHRQGIKGEKLGVPVEAFSLRHRDLQFSITTSEAAPQTGEI